LFFFIYHHIFAQRNLPLQPFMEKYTKIPFPMELVLVVAGVFAATGLELKKNYHIADIGTIPKGYFGLQKSLSVPKKVTFLIFLCLIDFQNSRAEFSDVVSVQGATSEQFRDLRCGLRRLHVDGPHSGRGAELRSRP